MEWEKIETIAVVGLSDKPERASFKVAKYMQEQGYRIIPINPGKDSILGEKSYASLLEIPNDIHIDMVNVFRKSEVVPEIVDEVLKLKPSILWLQEGIVHEVAATKAKEASVEVIMDKCLMKEHKKDEIK